MAFNPFHAFRKHQKVAFALLTILCMFVFVLSGAMGTFQEFTRWFGGGRGRGVEVATLYGKPVTVPDLSDLRVQREIANYYMVNALTLADHSAARQVMEAIKNSKLEQATKDRLSQILGGRDFLAQFASQPGAQQFLGQQYQQYEQQLTQIRQSLEAQGKKDEAQLAQRVERLLENLFTLLRLHQPRVLFFGGSLDADNLVDFQIWRHQADRLGIQFSRQDLRNLVNQVTQAFATERLQDEDRPRLYNMLQQRYRSLTVEQLSDCLDNEFRVQMAQMTLLGGDTQPLPSLTPYELWSFFREQRTESVIAMLPIPVVQKAFLDKVPEPTEEELKTYFDKHKDRLYNPASPEAGFKQPTRIQLEWVRARPDSPIYQQATEIALETIRATLPVAYETALASEYEKNRFRFLSPVWFQHDPGVFQLNKRSIDRPANAAAAVGQALANSGMQGPAALSSWTTFVGSAVVSEIHDQMDAGMRLEPRDRLRAGLGVLLSGFGGSPLNIVAAAGASLPPTEYLPLERVKPFLVDQLRETLHQQLFASSVKSLEDQLSKLSQLTVEDRYKASIGPSLLGQALASTSSSGLEFLAWGIYKQGQELLVNRHFGELALSFAWSSLWTPVPLVDASLAVRGKPSDWNFLDKSLSEADVQKVVAKAVKEYDLEHGSTRQPRDRYTIGDDPGLAPLREAFDRPWGAAHSAQTNTKLFAQEVFNRVEHTALFAPQRYTPPGSFDREEFLYWKAGERPAFVPTFAEVKDRVALRWKMEKARALAKEEAEKIVAKLPKNSSGPDVKAALQDASPQLAGKVFELDHVARLTTDRPALPSRFSRQQQYSPYTVPSSKIEYASPDLTKKLLDMNKEGEAIVVHDQPEANYYVAVLVYRTAPYELTFFSEAKSPDSLLSWYETDTHAREKARASLLAQLRQEANFKVVDQNAFDRFNKPGSGNLEE